MDQRERVNDLIEALRAALDGRQSEIWTAMPGILQSFNAADNTCSVKIAIKMKVSDKNGKVRDTDVATLEACPVIFQQGGGFALTFPLAQGDEGLLVFASRCIDTWWDQGAVAAQAEFRMHSLSDGFFIPGVRSKPNALSGISADSVQLRTEDGSVFVEVAAGGITLNGNVSVTGNLTVDGTVSDSGVQIGSAHTHSGVTVGGGTTGPVTP